MSDFDDLDLGNTGGGDDFPAAFYEVPLEIVAVLGRQSIRIEQVLKLGRGAVVELDQKITEPLELYANQQLFARGEVYIEDDRIGVKITEIVGAPG